MKAVISVTFAAFSLLAASGVAAQTDGEEAPATTEQSDVQEWAATQPQIICEYVRRTGSLIRERRCRTEAQLEAERENSLNAVREIDERSRRPKDEL